MSLLINSWKVENSDLQIGIRDSFTQNEKVVSLMGLNKDSTYHTIYVINNNDAFSALERFMNVCDGAMNKIEFLLDEIDKNRYEIKEGADKNYLPKNHLVVNHLLSDILRGFKSDLHIILEHDKDTRIYVPYISTIWRTYGNTMGNPIKASALAKLRENLIICQLTVDRLKRSIWNVLVDHDNPECLIEGTEGGLKKQGELKNG